MTDAPQNVPPPTDSPNPPSTDDGGTQTNQQVAQAIADALETGLQHPGNKTAQQPPAALLNPMFRPKGQPPHIAQAIRESNRGIAQAIIHLIENNGYKIVAAETDGHHGGPIVGDR